MVTKIKSPTTQPPPSLTAIDDLLLSEESSPTPIASGDLARIVEQADELRALRRAIAQAEEVLKQLKSHEFTLVTQTLPSLMDAAGKLRALTLEDGSKLERKEEVFASISQENAEAAASWLVKHGYGAIVKTTIAVQLEKGDAKARKAAEAALRKARIPYECRSGVHPQTLKAFVRESIERGRALPEIIKVHVQPNIKLTAPKD